MTSLYDIISNATSAFFPFQKEEEKRRKKRREIGDQAGVRASVRRRLTRSQTESDPTVRGYDEGRRWQDSGGRIAPKKKNKKKKGEKAAEVERFESREKKGGGGGRASREEYEYTKFIERRLKKVRKKRTKKHFLRVSSRFREWHRQQRSSTHNAKLRAD
ncbi:MAG: hypothetical protein P4L61_02870 [Candidatus Pacebacteria bacterium]|nr:hypothetical protein [Candidatus Paceibacterota bacterium]